MVVAAVGVAVVQDIFAGASRNVHITINMSNSTCGNMNVFHNDEDSQNTPDL